MTNFIETFKDEPDGLMTELNQDVAMSGLPQKRQKGLFSQKNLKFFPFSLRAKIDLTIDK